MAWAFDISSVAAAAIALVAFLGLANPDTSIEEDQKMKLGVDVERTNLTFVGSIGSKSYYWETTTNVTWIESLEICHLHGMYMAAIETKEQDALLKASGERLGWKTYLNIAGTDIFSERNWRWMRSGKAFNYTNWFPGSPYPDPDGRNWNCLALDPNAPWKWVDMRCGLYKCITLCEFP